MINNSYCFFFRCLLCAFLYSKKDRIIIKDLFVKFSYRYLLTNACSYKNILQYLKKSVKLLLFSNNNCTHGEIPFLAYDGHIKVRDLRYKYPQSKKVDGITFVFRDALPNFLNTYQRAYYCIWLLFVFLFLSPVVIFKKDKAKPSLILLELTEVLLLIRILKVYKTKRLYIYSAFEKEITFLTYLLHINKIETCLIPSSNPLSLFYKSVICDTFIFTAPFQKKEYENLKKNWYVKSFETWIPFGSQSIKLNANKIRNNNQLGLVSSGMALRRSLNHVTPVDNNDWFAEEALIASLKNFLNMHSKFSILIYLHPFEKTNNDYLNFSIDYYKSIFGAATNFAPFESDSKKCFDLCSVAIAGFSSAHIERLYGGYKALFAPMGFLSNYFSDQRLDAISVHNYNELEKMILKTYDMSDDIFFEVFNLKEYRWDNYNSDTV